MVLYKNKHARLYATAYKQNKAFFFLKSSYDLEIIQT